MPRTARGICVNVIDKQIAANYKAKKESTDFSTSAFITMKQKKNT